MRTSKFKTPIIYDSFPSSFMLLVFDIRLINALNFKYFKF